MKTNFTLLKSSLMVLFLCLGLSSWGQTTVASNFEAQNGNIGNDNTISYSSEQTNSLYWNPLRVYANTVFSVQSNNEAVITSISITYNNNYYNVLNTYYVGENSSTTSQISSSSIDGVTPTRIFTFGEGDNVKFFTFTSTAQIRLDSITVTYITANSCETSDIAFTNAIVTTDLADGNTFTQTATSLNATTAITYESSDEAIATVNTTTGEVTLVGLGTVTITATQEAGEDNGTDYCAGTVTYELTVITTEPLLTVSTNSVSFTGFAGGASVTEDITIEGLNLTGDIALVLSGDTNFSINPASLSSTGGAVTITYTPSATPATHSATLTVSNGSLSEVITLSGVTNEMPEAPAVCGLEDFTNAVDLPTGSNYGGGTFTGNDDIEWSYHGQSAGEYEIDGNGFLLRRASDSYLEVTIPNGVVEFSFDYRKAYTGNNSRQLELLVNGISVATSPTFGTSPSGEDTTVYTFTHTIDVEGEVTIRIKLTGIATTNRHTTIDNITWTCYSPVIWTGTEWVNGTPSIDEDVVVEGPLVVGTDIASLEAKSLTVVSGGSVYIESGSSVTVAGAIDNQVDAADFVVESGANLVQTDDVENSGDITVYRDSQPMKRLDYTLWSSPVEGMLLKDFSQVSPSGGTGTIWNRVYTLGTTSWEQVWASQSDFQNDTTSTFVEAQGYLYRSRNDYSATETTIFEGEFIGIPHNGTKLIATSNDYDAVGNPYPSTLNADLFLQSNADVAALHFWTNTNAPVDGDYDAAPNNWASYTFAGGIGTNAADSSSIIPNGLIAAGQGFVVETSGTSVTFNNTMRSIDTGMFFKTMEVERHRLWLNLSIEDNMLNQMMIAYMDGATENVDSQIDGKMFGYEGSALYSIITSEEDAYAIQGRSLPFTNTDTVALGFRAVQAGTYSVSLADFDGLFADGQDIYLKDNATQTYHDLKAGAYTFVSTVGIFDSRFKVVYQADGGLSTNNPTVDNKWIVYSQNNGFQIEAQGFEIKEVVVYDMLGRLIYNNQAEGTSHTISNIANGVLIVKVITTDNQVLTRKTAK